MIGLDTNVLVRYIAQDDATQSQRASTLIESLTDVNQGFISVVAVVELVWVMQGSYQTTQREIVAILEKLLRVGVFHVENAEVVLKALHIYAHTNTDFADCLIERSGHHARCSHTVTFDSAAAKRAGMCLIA